MIEDLIERGLRAVTQLGDDEIAKWLPALFASMPAGEINTPRRIAAFLGQCSHECGGFTRFEESLNYANRALGGVFGPRGYAAAGLGLGRPEGSHTPLTREQQLAIADVVYGMDWGKKHLGNNPGTDDARRFIGRGIVQLTGRDNYARFGATFGLTAEQAADFVAKPSGAVASAVWYWTEKHINDAADSWDIDAVTGLINAGMDGKDDRQRLCDAALAAIGDTETV